jgi:hypothetical protein
MCFFESNFKFGARKLLDAFLEEKEKNKVGEGKRNVNCPDFRALEEVLLLP